MSRNEMMQPSPTLPVLSEVQMEQLPPEAAAAFGQMYQAMIQTQQAMSSMAGTMRRMMEEMNGLRREVRLLTKVTPAQANAINTAIRERAIALCCDYRVQGCEKAVGNAIRRAVKLTTGISNVRELPRCEFSVAMQQIGMWDDYKVMKAIKAKGGTSK